MSNLKQILKKIVYLIGSLIFFFRKKNVKKENINKILIISLYFRGDLLFHTPVISNLKKIFPDSVIDIWTKSRSADIVTHNPKVNEVIVYDNIQTADYESKLPFDLSGKIDLIRKLRKGKYDLVIDLTGKYSTALVTLFSGSKYSIGLNYNGFGFVYSKYVDINTSHTKGHLMDKYLTVLAEGLAIPRENLDTLHAEMFLAEDVEKQVEELLNSKNLLNDRPLISIHTTAGWSAKELSTGVFSELIIKLRNELNYNVILVGGDSDREKANDIYKTLNEGLFASFDDFFSPYTMQESSEIIRRSNVFIGSDSFPLHVAGAFDVPSIGIFGPTNPEFSNPIGDKHLVVYHKLYCSSKEFEQFCSRDAGKTCPTIDCMKMITAEQIIDKINYLLPLTRNNSN